MLAPSTGLAGLYFIGRYAPLKTPLATQLLANDRRALHERGELLLHHPARRLPESAIRIEPELVGRDVLQDRANALGHVGRRLGPERLHISHARRQLLAARELLPEPQIVHAPVRELQHDLRGAQIAHERVEVAEVPHRRERTPVEVAEADVNGDLRLDALDDAV